MLCISILCYNQPEITKECIQHLQKNTTGDWVIRVFDNGSKRPTHDMLDSLLSDTRIAVIHSEQNIGFIGANNYTFSKYRDKCDYFCVLNNDLIIHEKGWNQKLADAMTANGWSIAGAKQRFELDHRMWGVPRTRPELDYVDGSLMMIKPADLAFLPSLFDEQYLKHIYCEDSDLCLRAKNHGLKIGEVDLDIDHKHQATCGKEKIRIDLAAARDHNLATTTDRWMQARNENRKLKILVRRSHAIGDVLCIEPILRALPYKYPSSTITVETMYPQVLEHTGIKMNAVQKGQAGPSENYDRVIDLWPGYELYPCLPMVDAYAKIAGVVLPEGGKIPRFDPTLHRTPGRKFRVMFCADGGWASRTWPLDRWRNVLLEIASDGIEIVEVGLNPELHTKVGRNMIGKFDDLHGLAKFMGECDLFIGPDCGLMHLAQAVDLPVLAVFGCTYPGVRIHDWSRARTVWLDQEAMPCAGCHHLRPAPNPRTDCDNLYCLDRITEQMVLDAYYNKPNGQKPPFHVREFKGVSE